MFFFSEPYTSKLIEQIVGDMFWSAAYTSIVRFVNPQVSLSNLRNFISLKN